METPEIKITESQKKANEKYRVQNKDKVNIQRKKYYQSRKDNDPNFLIYKRQKAKEYYAKKKAEKAKLQDKTEIIEPVKLEPIFEKVIDQTELGKLINDAIQNTEEFEITNKEKKKRVYKKKE